MRIIAVFSRTYYVLSPVPAMVLAVILAAVGTRSPVPWLLIPSALALLVLTFDQLLRIYRWTLGPIDYLNRFDDFLKKKRLAIIMPVLHALPRDPDSEVFKSTSSALARLHEMLTTVKEAIDADVTAHGLLKDFLFRFACCFLLVVLAFGFAYLAGWKVDSGFFSSAAQSKPSGGEALFYSVTTVSTSGISGLTPVSSAAKILTTLQHFCGLTLLVLIVLCFSLVHGDIEKEVPEALKQIHRRLDLLVDEWEYGLLDIHDRKYGQPK
jgi:hypothetical protein